MTARKPKARKPVPRKRSKTPTKCACGHDRTEYLADMAQINRNFITIEGSQKNHKEALQQFHKRIESLETRAKFRDASHDEPVSNAGEAVGQHFTVIAELPRAPWWRRFLTFMRLP